jgi:hypothetical protein
LEGGVLFNGSGVPTPKFRGSIVRVDSQESHGVVSYPDDTVLPDILDSRLASPFASVTIMNTNLTMYATDRCFSLLI